MENSSTDLIFVILDVLIWNNFSLNTSTVRTAEAGLLGVWAKCEGKKGPAYYLPTKGTVNYPIKGEGQEIQ